MTGRRSIVFTCLLGVLIISAIAAASASAEQLVYRCVPTAPKLQFSDAHCLNKVSEGAKFGHEVWGTSPGVLGATNADTASGTTAAAPSKLKGALSGVETEITCTTVGGMGSLSNGAAAFTASGTLEYSGCSVTKPAGKGCAVAGGAITTKELFATNEGQAENTFKITPQEGTEFASIKIESCSNEALNNTFPVTGSVIPSVSGSTVSTTHTGITAQATLKFGGNKAGLEGALTFKRQTEFALALT